MKSLLLKLLTLSLLVGSIVLKMPALFNIYLGWNIVGLLMVIFVAIGLFLMFCLPEKIDRTTQETLKEFPRGWRKTVVFLTCVELVILAGMGYWWTFFLVLVGLLLYGVALIILEAIVKILENQK